jgi:hypothetical protein
VFLDSSIGSTRDAGDVGRAQPAEQKKPRRKESRGSVLTKRERGHTAHVCHGTSSRATTGHAAALPNVWTTAPPHPRSPALIGGGMGRRPHPWPAVQGPVPAHLRTDIARRHREVPVVRMIRGICGLRPQACAGLFQEGVRCHRGRARSPPGGGRHRASAGPAERNAMLPIGCWACLRCIPGSFFGNAVVPRMFHTGRAHSSSFLGALIYEQVNLR